jgi:hypothetical protein
MKCKIHSDIVPKTPSGQDVTGCGNLDIATGGIQAAILLFNADEVSNLEFYDDMRFDENLVVETIVTDSTYFKIDGVSIDYKETFTTDNKHVHTLTLSLNNIHSSLESTLFDAKNGRYIVCFKPKGQEYYRMFGWVEGAVMKVELVINDGTTAYNITFSYESIYPLFQVNSSNFKLEDKYYSPIWQPLYNVAYCQLSGSTRTGYAIAEYVVKINQAGQGLDRNDQLCSITGLPQQAYKYVSTVGDGGYEIVGTYNENGVFDGKPVKVYDETLCPPNAVGTISVNPTSIKLNSTTVQSAFTLTCSNAWWLKEEPTLVTVQPNSGTGNSAGIIKQNNSGGTNIILFQNKTTKEIVQVYVNIYLIKVTTSLTYNSGTTDFSIPVIAEGGSGNFTYVTPSGLTITKNGNVLNCHIITPTTTAQDYSIVITHADDLTETKTVNVHVNGLDTNPKWVQISSYCKLV